MSSAMRFSVDEVRAVVEEAKAACPDLGRLNAAEVVGSVIGVAAQGLRGIEAQVAEAGGITEETAGVYAGFGAIAEVLGQLPEGDDRRQLFEAGRAAGRLLAKKWGEEIKRVLAERAGTH